MTGIKTLTKRIIKQAYHIGFDSVGICHASLPQDVQANLCTFLANHCQGDMYWLGERIEQRTQPRKLWPQACSIISLGMSYAPNTNPLAIKKDPLQGHISVYAQNRDYHKYVKGKLKHLAQFIVKAAHENKMEADVKVFVDTAPVSEKPIAQKSGLGWQGKNTNLISKQFGNWLFLGEIYTTLLLHPTQSETSHCGSCHRCLDICPTQAFIDAGKIDARRCISYLTIEHEGPFPYALRRAIGSHIYGCDDCLAICPWNKFATPSPHEAFWPIKERVNPSLAYLVQFDDQDFRQFFSASPVKRIGITRFLRNVLNAIGNSQEPALIRYVQPHLHSHNDIIRDGAQWAISQLTTDTTHPK